MSTILSPKASSPKSHTPGHQRRTDGHTISPNYFGLAVEAKNSTINSSAARFAKDNWSPQENPRPSVSSTPLDLPIHPSPNYDSFRTQSERKTFNLSETSLSGQRPQPTRKESAKSSSDGSSSRIKTTPPLQTSSVRQTLTKAETLAELDGPQVSRSPKRSLAPDTPDESSFQRDRKESGPKYSSSYNSRDSGSPPPRHDEKHPRLSLPGDDTPLPPKISFHRAETVPASLDDPTPTLVTSQCIANVLDSSGEEFLLLDLRVSTHYSRSHIVGALNLCIPTTLLKRSSYTVERLAETFKVDWQRAKFERWRSCKGIILYDTSSSHIKEAANCVNILKKFAAEGWEGDSYILKGGFADFAKKFSSYIEVGDASYQQNAPSSPNTSCDEESLPPVIGGCEMPATKNAANPFFGNIRQNMDLIGGVGQISIQRPKSMDHAKQNALPRWLQNTTSEEDDGRHVSEKFLRLEKKEQKRMQEALSGEVVYGNAESGRCESVQIAGIEKGSKNRYNNIWPFEHSRVKLENVPSDGCDYVNANFVQTSMSHKKYIATQGPIPATFTDFWNMVWQRDIRVIVMLTAETEGGQVKAHNYWSGRSFGHLKLSWHSEQRASLDPSKIYSHKHRPSLQRRRTSSDKHGSISKKSTPIDLTDAADISSDQPHVIVRRFTLSHDSHPFERMREITQLQYSSWPDFGAPAHPAHLLGLVEHCDAVVRSTLSPGSFPVSSTLPDPPTQRPVLVHCSAGCGRTGTFCTVDSVVDMLKRQRQRGNPTVPGVVKDPNSMDVDKNQQPSTSKTHAKRSSFGGAPPVAAAGADSVEGEWTRRDDLDLVEATVAELRLQRLSMVQSLRQFVLCYESVLEWITRQGGSKAA